MTTGRINQIALGSQFSQPTCPPTSTACTHACMQLLGPSQELEKWLLSNCAVRVVPLLHSHLVFATGECEASPHGRLSSPGIGAKTRECASFDCSPLSLSFSQHVSEGAHDILTRGALVPFCYD